MKKVTVTFFGHRDAPKEIEPSLRSVLIDLIENKKAAVFYVGNNGSFDAMVYRQLSDLSKIYSIEYSTVLAYMPNKKHGLNENLEHTVFPEGFERFLPKFAINCRNKWMIDRADIVVTYVTHLSSGAAKFKELSRKMNKEIIDLSKLKAPV